MIFDAPETWQADDLTCTRTEAGDLDFRIALFSRPEMVAHRPNPVPDSREALRQGLIADMDHWSIHGIGRWTVSCDGERIGFCGLTVKDGFDGLNISYHVAPEHWGKGSATVLASGLVRVAGHLTTPPSRIYGLVRPANPASARILQKLGFHNEGAVQLGGAPTHLWFLNTKS